MFRKTAALALTLFAAVASQGCATWIRIERTRPPAFAIKDGATLALDVQADGTVPSATTVMDAALGATQGQILNKWMAVEPVRNEFTAKLRTATFKVENTGAATLIIRIKPTAWSYQLASDSKKPGRVGTGRLDVRLDVLDARNPSAAPLYSETYWGQANAENLGEPEAMLRASQRIASRFIADLRPQRVSEEVQMDKDDDAVKPALALCEDGQFDAAYLMLADLVKRSPNSAPALYDLGVLTEARGSYDEAEHLIMRATELAQKPMYYTALDRIRRSRADAQAMNANE